jgi:hypothetical protein
MMMTPVPFFGRTLAPLLNFDVVALRKTTRAAAAALAANRSRLDNGHIV